MSIYRLRVEYVDNIYHFEKYYFGRFDSARADYESAVENEFTNTAKLELLEADYMGELTPIYTLRKFECQEEDQE